MAESLVTQVARPDDHAGQPRPARKPKLKLDLDVNGNPVSADDGDVKADVDNRFTGLGKIFSRQFTPTVPKTTDFQDKENRVNAQSPRAKVQSPKGLATHQENESHDPDTEPAPAADGKRSIWQSIWSRLLPDNESPKSDGTPSDAEVPNVNSPKGKKSNATDFPTAATKPAPAPAPVVAPIAEPEEDSYVPDPDALLPPNTTGKKHCLVLDLDETLVHSSFKPVSKCDFVLSIEMDGITHKIYVLKRPGVDEFLTRMAQTFELVIFTASLDKYANPLIDLLDPQRTITGRLFREHCTRQGQTYVKDLGRLGRRLENVTFIDNSPYSYVMHMNNSIPIITWFDDPHDTELIDMMPFLENLTKLPDVAQVLDANKPWRVTNKKLLKVLNETEDS